MGGRSPQWFERRDKALNAGHLSDRDRARSEAGLRRLRDSGASAVYLARFAMTNLHDREAALDWLEKSLRNHEPDIVDLAIDPRFDEVRGDPRAVAILRAVLLSPCFLLPADATL